MTPVERAICNAKKAYTPTELVLIDSNIRRLAKEHYMYGNMPLVYGKARGIRNILEVHYGVNVDIRYVWDVLEEMNNEPQE